MPCPSGHLRPVGWIRREILEDIMQPCREVTGVGFHCCHEWAHAVIDTLRADAVLRPPRESDDGAIHYGPEAPEGKKTEHA
jgi:hypothetical protein